VDFVDVSGSPEGSERGPQFASLVRRVAPVTPPWHQLS
jgi:hypothetical protein